MIRLLMLGVAAAALPASAAGAQIVTPEAVKYGPAPPALPAGAEFAVLSGDPGKAGLFTIRLKTPAGYAVAPHHHPAPELVTILDGQMSYGMGDTADPAKAAALTQGGYFVAEANMNHYVFTGPAGATVQITSQGPFQIIYVNPADDPRNAGAAERGR